MTAEQQEKARFFALYYGQKVWCNPFSECQIIRGVDLFSIEDNEYLNLVSLEYLSNKDANDIDYFNKDEAIEDFNYEGLRCSYSADILRSRGYALPYMGLSVEKLIEYGWIKLNVQPKP